MILKRNGLPTLIYRKTKEILLTMKGAPQKFENQGARLLYAVSLQKLGEKNEALKEYETFLPAYVGEEARCRYALFLKELGRGEDAKKIFELIVKKCKISPPFYRKENKTWFETAQNELKNG